MSTNWVSRASASPRPEALARSCYAMRKPLPTGFISWRLVQCAINVAAKSTMFLIARTSAFLRQRVGNHCFCTGPVRPFRP